MLVFTRGRGERFMIGGNMTVTILSIEDNKVKVGADAPKDVSVHREEIYKRIQREKGRHHVA